MAAIPSPEQSAAPEFRGKIIEAEINVSVDAGLALPPACTLYAVERPQGVWRRAYYGSSRSVFDDPPQKGAELEGSKLGIAFQAKQFMGKKPFPPAAWEELEQSHWTAYSAYAA